MQSYSRYTADRDFHNTPTSKVSIIIVQLTWCWDLNVRISNSKVVANPNDAFSTLIQHLWAVQAIMEACDVMMFAWFWLTVKSEEQLWQNVNLHKTQSKMVAKLQLNILGGYAVKNWPNLPNSKLGCWKRKVINHACDSNPMTWMLHPGSGLTLLVCLSPIKLLLYLFDGLVSSNLAAAFWRCTHHLMQFWSKNIVEIIPHKTGLSCHPKPYEDQVW